MFREHEANLANENKSMTSELNDLRMQLERLTYEGREAAILAEATREQNNDLTVELEELRKSLAELKSQQKSMSNEGKERKKQEKLAQLMGNFEYGGGAASERDEQVKAALTKLEQAIDSQTPLSTEDLATLRQHLNDTHVMSRRQALHNNEDYEALQRRKDELELRVAALEQECEDLFDKGIADGSSDLRVRSAPAPVAFPCCRRCPLTDFVIQ